MIDALYTARSGLSVSRYAVDTTSNNIANENTEGYKKRVVQTSEVSIWDNDQVGDGISFDGVTRTTSQYLFEQLISQNSKMSYYSQEDTMLSGIETLFSETDSSGFSITLSNFFNSVETLRGESANLIYQNDLTNQSELLVSSLQNLYSGLEEMEQSNLEQLNDQVDQANTILEQIVYLNEEIVKRSDVANDLLDKRDQLEQELSELVDIEVDTNNGNYELKVGEVTAVFNNKNLHELSVSEEYIAQKDIYTTTDLDDASVADGQTVTLTLNNTTSVSITASTSGATENELKQQIVDEINTNSAFSSISAYLDSSNNLVIKSDVEGESGAFDLEIDVDGTTMQMHENSVEASNNVGVSIYAQELDMQSGSMLSLSQSLTTSTSKISEYKQSLDDFAKALVEAVSSSSSTTLFTGSSVNTLAFVEGSVESLSSSDLESLAQIQWSDEFQIDSRSSETTSFSEFYQQLLVTISSDTENNAFKLDSQEAIVNNLQTAHDEITKVDSDEEMINLLKYQAAYEANAKVITVVDEMLQTLLNM